MEYVTLSTVSFHLESLRHIVSLLINVHGSRNYNFLLLSGFSLDAKCLLLAQLARLKLVPVVGGTEKTGAAGSNWQAR